MATGLLHRSVVGKLMQLSRKNGQLLVGGLTIGTAAGDATITVGNESTNVRAITIQLKDFAGHNIANTEVFELGLYLDTTPTDFVATGGSTGIAIGANGKLLATVAKKLFRCVTDATGKWTGTWTDTGTEAFALGVRLPNGRLVMSAAFANT